MIPLVQSPPTPRWLRAYTKFVAASTLFLIFAGAMVTSTGSGLAVPDWPNTYGQFMFSFPLSKMVGGIFYEHGHRLIASIVGLLTIIQAVWLQRREPKRMVRILGWVSLAAVLVQGLLGGLTVIFLLPPAISISHAGLAEIFFCINIAIAFFTSEAFRAMQKLEKGDVPVVGTTFFVILVYAQVIVGALMRHVGAGLAIPDFPLAFGRIVPAFTTTAIAVHYLHRLGGVLIMIGIVALFLRLRRFESAHPLRQVTALLLTVIPAQILLGGYTIWSGKHPVVTSLHVVLGASTLALSVVLWLTARTTGWRVIRTPAEMIPREVAA